MPAIKRYDFYTKETLAENNGPWIRYADHIADIAAREKQHQATLAALRDSLERILAHEVAYGRGDAVVAYDVRAILATLSATTDPQPTKETK